MTIQIYTKPDCTYCVQAKDLLTKCNLTYEEFTVGIHITKEELIEHLKRNVKTVPQIVIDKEENLYEQIMSDDVGLTDAEESLNEEELEAIL